MKRRNFAIAGLLATMAIITTQPLMASSLAQDAAAPAAGTTPADQAAALASALRADLGALPASATAEDMEATIVFRLSQGNYDRATMAAALTAVASPADTNLVLRNAVTQVRLALLARKLNRGTAALALAGGLGYSSGFSSPLVSIGGGGSSNYLQ